jgi:hypothetical protein
MRTPIGYFRHKLEGKSPSEILSKIRGLKNEIGRLKNRMEAQDKNDQPEFHTDLAKELYLKRCYLEGAKQALVEAGGRYIPSKQEQKIDAFNESIPFITKIIFTIGGYFDGCEIRTLVFQNDQPFMTINRFPGTFEDEDEIKKEIPYTKDEFLDDLAFLNIGEWKARYDHPSVLDGTQWKLEIYFSNDHKKVEKTGSNAYPYNFIEFCELLGFEDETESDEE